VPTYHSISSVSDGVDDGGSFVLPPFLFILDGGGVKPTRRLHFFSFTPLIRGVLPPCGVDKRGRCETHTRPPFPFVYPPIAGGISSPQRRQIGGSVKLTRSPRFLSFTPQ